MSKKAKTKPAARKAIATQPDFRKLLKSQIQRAYPNAIMEIETMSDESSSYLEFQMPTNPRITLSFTFDGTTDQLTDIGIFEDIMGVVDTKKLA